MSPAAGPPLILASASPGRARVLEAAGVDFTTRVSSVDEDEVLAAARAVDGEQDLSPAEAALLLARAKAEDVAAAQRHAPDHTSQPALVLGCDSVFELDGEACGKPYEVEIAVERWRAMRGRTGVLHSGHWLIDDTGEAAGRTVSTEVSFAAPRESQIRAYAESGEPLHCAGAFTIDGRGAAFVRGVCGDHLSVIGVSPHMLAELMAELGHDITAHWRDAHPAAAGAADGPDVTAAAPETGHSLSSYAENPQQEPRGR